jgi:hypothetical protein
MTMKMDQDQTVERILESAIVANWRELMHGAQSALVQVEYGYAPSGSLDYLRVWSSITRGYWLLACAYWTSASGFHNAGVHFENGYQSEGLAQIWKIVMQHQDAFPVLPNLARQGLGHLTTPTEEECTAAAAAMSDLFAHFSSAPAEPLLATG